MKKYLQIVFCTVLFLLTMTQKAAADMGPKPSVNIRFQNVEKEYYVTLLGKEEIYGPYSASDSYSSNDENENKAFQLFYDYTKQDEYFFLGNIQKISPDKAEYSWNYYPPKEFRVAVCDPETGTLRVSEPLERVAFYSYFRVDLAENGLIVKEEIHLKNEILGFLLRVILTVVIETVLGFLFGYRQKKEVLTIVRTNLFTQILLNLIMGFLDYYSGALVWIFIFPAMELAVVIIEMIVYLRKFSSHSRFKTVIYTLLANALTLLLGVYLGLWVGFL